MKPFAILIFFAFVVTGAFFLGFAQGQADVRTTTIVRLSEPYDPIYRGLFFGKCYNFHDFHFPDRLIAQACATDLAEPPEKKP